MLPTVLPPGLTDFQVFQLGREGDLGSMAGSWVEGTRSWCFVCRAVRPNCAVCEVCGVAPELFSVLADEVGPDAEMLAEYREGFGMFAGDDGTLDRAKLGTMFRSLGQDYDDKALQCLFESFSVDGRVNWDAVQAIILTQFRLENVGGETVAMEETVLGLINEYLGSHLQLSEAQLGSWLDEKEREVRGLEPELSEARMEVAAEAGAPVSFREAVRHIFKRFGHSDCIRGENVVWLASRNAAAAGDAADNDNASDGDEDGVEMTVEQFRALMKQRADDAPHLAAIDALVRRRIAAPGALPVALAPELLLSDWAGVADAAALRRDLGVTHVFSCIEGTYLSRDDAIARYAAAGIAYDGVRADDDDAYPMLRRHFERFLAFVEPLRGARGGAAARCVVHCAGGMNRSGVLAVAYVCHTRRWNLLRAVEHCSDARGPLVWNAGFQRELVRFARDRGLVE